jgi:putative holliday junction resolvase
MIATGRATSRSGPQSFLAFDFGTRRIGVAAGNTVSRTAQPLTTLAVAGAQDAVFEPIARLIAEWQPDALIIGVPFHPDGAEHDNTRRARAFGRRLHGRFELPVHEVDERYSTTEAMALGAGADRPGGAQGTAQLDARAAAVILEQYLRTLPEPDAAA